eukprot:gene11495-11638_t
MALKQAAGSLLQRLGAVSLESSVLVSSSAQATGLLGSGSANAVRHGSNQAVKQRIRAIKNIGKITKAMKMVAASKMRNAQLAVENSRGMVNPFVRLFGDYPAIDPPKSVTVAVTSDKGLCGGLNSNITKYTKALLQMYKGSSEASGDSIITIGDKGRAQLQRVAPDKIKISIADTYKDKVTFSQASLIAEEVLRQHGDAVRVLFNKFHSAISFRPTLSTVLNADLEVANERADALQDLSEFQLAVNSSKSAGEILGRLTLQYNRDRQATITNELIEIISGAAALEESG